MRSPLVAAGDHCRVRSISQPFPEVPDTVLSFGGAKEGDPVQLSESESQETNGGTDYVRLGHARAYSLIACGEVVDS